jgi:hypothetical protein
MSPRDIPGEITRGGTIRESENLIQIFLMDSAYWNFQVFHKKNILKNEKVFAFVPMLQFFYMQQNYS